MLLCLIRLIVSIRFIYSYILHKPVLLKESINYLVTNKSGMYIDGTAGSGGHSQAILSSLDSQGSLVCVDRDPEAVSYLREVLPTNTTILLGNFGFLSQLLQRNSLPRSGYSGIMLDLGVSAHQLEDADRGFSYQRDANLDMRMSNPRSDSDTTSHKPPSCNTAQYIINNWSEERLCSLFKEFGEEPRSSSIAKYIVQYRNNKPITTTSDLREIVLRAVFNHRRNFTNIPHRAHPVLARIFQSLRLAVNDELQFLEQFLESSHSLIEVGGRILIISYHSLEDRIVKNGFKKLSNDTDDTKWKILTKKCIMSSDEEININPRSRSAKMRCIERIS